MSIRERDQTCTILTNKLMSGERLDAAEKAHLSQCTECMREIVLHLDLRADEIPISITDDAAAPTAAKMSPEVREALDRGRGVFVREFGL